MIALLNLSVLGFSFVFHDKAKITEQENLLRLVHIKTGLMIKLLTLVFVCHKQVNVKKISVLQGAPIDGLS